MDINFKPHAGAPATRVTQAPGHSALAPATRHPTVPLALHAGSTASLGELLAALFFFALGSYLFWAAVESGQLAGGFLSGVLAVGGAVAVFLVVRRLRDQSKFRGVKAYMVGAGPTVGGRLDACVDLPPQAAEAGGVTVELECTRTEFESDRSFRKVSLWTGRARFPVQGRRLNIALPIPPELPPTTQATAPGEPVCAWTLRITAEVPGVDLDRTYVLPVGQGEPSGAVREEAVRVSNTAATTSARTAGESAAPVPARGSTSAHAASIAILVLGNLPVVLGAVYLDWSVIDIIALFWVENLVIGVANVLRMAASRAPRTPPTILARVFPMAFFVGSYCGFCAGHGTLLLIIFLRESFLAADGPTTLLGAMWSREGFALAVLGLIVSHLFSFWSNFIRGGEYRRLDLDALMFQPYRRVIVVHIFILVGGLTAMAAGSSWLLLALFVAIKIVVDVIFHLREHTRPGRAGTGAA